MFFWVNERRFDKFVFSAELEFVIVFGLPLRVALSILIWVLPKLLLETGAEGLLLATIVSMILSISSSRSVNRSAVSNFSSVT